MSTDWITSKLSDLTTKVGSGATPLGGEAAYKPSGTPLIRSMNVVFFGFKRAGLVFIDGAQAAALGGATVEAGDVLLNITGASIGRVTLAPSDMAGARVNQHVCIVRPGEALDSRFLNAYLSSPKVQAMIWADNAGTTRQALTKQQILGFEVPVPPLAEQCRIADKLDTVLARVDAVNDRLARVAPLLKRFRQSVLAAATSGRLTEEWRDQMGLRWEAKTVPLGQLGEVVTGNTPSKKTEANFGGDIPFFKPSDLDAGYEVHTASEYLSALGARQARLLPERSVLVTCIGATIGKTGFARRPCSTNQQINAVICGEEVQAEWLYFWMCSPAAQLAIVDNSSATTLPILNKSRFSALEVSVPSRGEQAEIVRRVELLFGYADRLEARLKAAQAATERLTPALLAKAFRGELVPQDPNDEPASELLRRLAESRAAAPAPRKRGRPARADA